MTTMTSNYCPGCAVPPGEAHDNGCDVARCMLTGQQRLVCQAIADEGPNAPDGHGGTVDIQPSHPGEDCGRDVWTGTWPGEAECIEFGWYARFTPGQGWVRCERDDSDPEVVPDLNRLIINARWDRELTRW